MSDTEILQMLINDQKDLIKNISQLRKKMNKGFEEVNNKIDKLENFLAYRKLRKYKKKLVLVE